MTCRSVCVCVFVYVCARMHVHVRAHVRLHECTHACLYVCTHMLLMWDETILPLLPTMRNHQGTNKPPGADQPAYYTLTTPVCKV